MGVDQPRIRYYVAHVVFMKSAEIMSLPTLIAGDDGHVQSLGLKAYCQ